MKKCPQCEMEKDLGSFYKSPKTKDGLYAYCKSCCKKRAKKWRDDNPEKRHKQIVEYKVKKKSVRTYNRGDRTSQSRRYSQLHRDAVLAQRKVDAACRKGILKRPNICSVCGIQSDNIHGHHEDYGKPLDVIWVCWLCHNNLHKFK